MILTAHDLSFRYGDSTVLERVDITIGAGITAIIGPNAAGKSTLLKCLCGLLRPRGQVKLDDHAMDRLSMESRAKLISYLPQEFVPRAVLTVFETVLLGRLYQLGWRVTAEETTRVEHLLDEMGLSELSGRYLNELSGGQLQMVAIAQALVREPAVLLMDEPTSNLDLRRQFDICALIRSLTISRGISTAITLHDLSIAARIADTIYVIEGGQVRCSGSPVGVLTAEMIAAVYGVESVITLDSKGIPIVTILGPVLTR